MMQASGNLVAFGAFDGLHTYNATLYLQVCIVLECASSEEHSCGKLTESSNLYFREFRITGNFTSKYTFPEMLVSNGGQPSLASGQFFDCQPGGALEVINGLRLPLISASLLSLVDITLHCTYEGRRTHRRQPSYLTLASFHNPDGSTASLFSAVQFHSAFAMGMKVNLLAANIQLPENGFHGSGIYTPDGYKTYYYSKKLNETKLLVADLQSVNSKFSTKASDTRNKNIFTTQSTRNVQNEKIIKTFNAFPQLCSSLLAHSSKIQTCRYNVALYV
jgi:hypothetical protein